MVNVSFDGSAGVATGSGFYNYLNNNRTGIGAEDEPVREVLAKVIGRRLSGVAAPSNSKFAWLMTRTPRSKEVNIFLYDVRAELIRPDGSQWLAPVVWISRGIDPFK